MQPDPLLPLTHCYAASGLPLPQVRMLERADVPEPARSLLVHDSDMTSTLQDYFGRNIHLEVLGKEVGEKDVRREVVLRLEDVETPVEFGAIAINMSQLPPEAEKAVRACWKPLGGILIQYKIPYSNRPSAFFTVAADELMSACFTLDAPAQLYGRCNTLIYPDGETLADVVEILPPLEQLLAARRP